MINLTGLIDTYPITIQRGKTCIFCCNARVRGIQLFIADWIVSYFLAVIANTDLKIPKTISWKHMICISSKCIIPLRWGSLTLV